MPGLRLSMPAAMKMPESTRIIAQALVIQGFSLRVVSEKTGLKLRTIQTWARRYGWRELRDKTKQEVNQAVAIAAASALDEFSTRSREWLAGEVQEQIGAQRNSPIKKPSELANSPKRQGRAAVLKTVTDAASTIFGWGDTTPGGILIMGDMRGTEPAASQPVIDVGAAPEPKPSVGAGPVEVQAEVAP